jgi:mono/diheme cytochrome c family protein
MTEDILVETPLGPKVQRWFYPGPQDCLRCHNANAGFVLGVTTRQLNGLMTYPHTGITRNQLQTWNELGLFSPALEADEILRAERLVSLDETKASLEHQVRSYLDANCAQCHRANGVSQASFDARYSTPLADQQIVNGIVHNPLGVMDARVVALGSVTHSIMHLRMGSVGAIQMPPLARNEVDKAALATVGAWIATLPVTPTMAPTRSTYRPGEMIILNCFNTAGSGVDWVGLYVPGTAHNQHLSFGYIGGLPPVPGRTNGTIYFTNGLPSPGIYEARLFHNDSYTLETTATFAVAMPPESATAPFPDHGAHSVSTNIALSWTPAPGADSQLLYFGTDANTIVADVEIDATNSIYTPGPLSPSTTYHWRLDAVNGAGTTPGETWTFTTTGPPRLFCDKPAYFPGEPIVVRFINGPGNALDWIGLYAAETDNFQFLNWWYADGPTSGSFGVTNGTITFHAGLTNAGAYEARLFFNDGYVPEASVAFVVQQPATVPEAASVIVPLVGEAEVDPTVTLRWKAGSGATAHRVYLGMQPDPGPAEFRGVVQESEYRPRPLAPGTTYYWRIDESNEAGSTPGEVSSFTTRALTADLDPAHVPGRR